MKRFISFLIVGVLATLLSINEVFALPSTQASQIVFSTLSNGKLRVIARKGDGTGRIIVIQEGASVLGTPTGTYTGNADFEFANTLDGTSSTGSVVYSGTDRRVDISGLTPGTQYTVKVFEYDSEGYNLTDLSDNPRSYTTFPAAPALTDANPITSSGFTINWIDPAGNFDGFEITVGLTSNFSTQITGWNPADVDVASNSVAFIGNTNTTYYYRIRSTLGATTSAWNTGSPVTTYPVTATLSESTAAICLGNTYFLTPTGPTPGDGTNEHKFKVYDSGNNLVNLGGFAYTVIPLTPSPAGTYNYYVATVSNKTGVETTERTTFTLNVNQPGATAEAGVIDDICSIGTYTVTLTGNEPGSGEGTWTYSGPEGAIIADDNLYNSQVELVNYGAYTFTWTITSDGCNSSYDVVSFNYYATPSTANAGTDFGNCGLTGNLSGNPPANGTGTWTWDSEDLSLTDVNSNVSGFTATAPGIYTLTWTIANGTCTPSADEVVLTIDQAPTTAVAGEDAGICVPTGTTTITYTLAATPVTVGSGEWTAVEGVTFDDATNPTTVVSVPTVGTYTLTWTTVSEYGVCNPSSDEVVLKFSPAIEQAEITGTSTIACDDLETELLANDPVVGNGMWTVSGPEGAELYFPEDHDAFFVAVEYGTYTLTWTISDPNGVCPSTSDEIVVVFSQAPDLADIPEVEEESNFACGFEKVLFAEPLEVGTGTWTLTQYPIDFDAEDTELGFTSNVNSNTVTFLTNVYGEYTFRWTVDGCIPNNFDEITVTFYNELAGWTAGADQTACINVASPLLGATNPTVYTEGIGTPAPNGEWVKFSGPLGEITYSPDRFTYNAAATFPQTGTYEMKWIGYNGPCVVEDTKVVEVVLPTTVSFNDISGSKCNNTNTTVDLSVLVEPTGGSFSGDGVSESSFSPLGLSAGTYTLTYSYTPEAGCTVYDYATVVVAAPTEIVWTNSNYNVCVDESINVSDATPDDENGTYSGLGVSATGLFDATGLSAGTYTITYTYVNNDGCTSVAENTVVVNPLPEVSFDPETPTLVCQNSTVIDLTEYVNPLGDECAAQEGPSEGPSLYTFTVYSGELSLFETCGTFDPSDLGPGTYTITYLYQDENTCEGQATHVIEVQETPQTSLTIAGLEFCANDNTAYSLSEYQSVYGLCVDGTWSFGGPGVDAQAGTFNPSMTGLTSNGPVTITYTYVCGVCTVEGYASVQIVIPDVIVFTDAVDESYCQNDPVVSLVANNFATPTGGVFVGDGVNYIEGTPYFNPSLANIGTNVITYTYTDELCTVWSTFEITVYAVPDAQFVDAPTKVCGNTDYFSFETYVSPEPNCMPQGHEQEIPGGYGEFTFSNGISQFYCGSFDPSQVSYGTYTVTYTYTNENNCTDFATHEFEVVAPPTVSFGTEVTPTYCTTESEGIDLTFFAYPAGGTFSGSGVQGDFFTPSNAGGAGTYTLTYTYTDQLTGCTNFDEMEFVLVAPTAITWTEVYDICANSSIVDLSGDALPLGGTYSGPGNTILNGSEFDPTGLSVGPYTITYTYDNGACITTATKVFNIRQNPDISWPDYQNNNSFCVTSTSVDIRNATPPGGSYRILPNVGLEITGNPFNPSALGVGTYTLTYTYVNVYGCVDIETKTITITNAPGSVAFSNPEGSFCNDDESGFDLTTLASPAGGTFAGEGVEGTTFSPFRLDAGTYTLTYSLTHACGDYFDTAEFIVVAPATIVWELNTATVCATETSFDIGGATPTGGTYDGGLISLDGTTFNPSSAGVGLHVFTYTYVDGPCESVATLEVEVVPAPVVTWTQTFADYYCANDNNGILLTGAPANGQYTVEPSTNALSAGTFTPSMAEAGTYTITYTVTIGSCSDYATKTIVVAPLPEVSAGVYENVCITASSFTLTAGTPSGGTYSGNGVLSNVFNPASAGVGIHTLTYTYQDPVTLCYNSATTTIQVDEQPVISWTATYGPYCESDQSMYQFNAQASIGTGEYSGPGVDGGYFSPSLVGAGTYTVTYTVTNGTCMAYETKTIVVDEQPVIFWTATYGPYCESDENSYELTASHTVGFGEYLGAGVSGGYFYPSEAGPGTHVITYTVTNGTCSAYATKTIVVDEQPVISWTATYGPYCESDESMYQFNAQASIGTGEYTGTGVSGGYFSPSVAGAGTYTVTYTVTNGTCMAYETKTIVVDAQPVISWTATYGPYCIDDTDGYTLGASATVGIGAYSGNGGVSGGTFTPSIAGVGTHTITYTVTNGTCSVYETKTIVVNPLPTVSAGTYAAVCQNAATFTLTAGTPSGGTYSGNGVVSNTFNPASAGVGVHTLTYVYTDEATGCTNSATTTITVNALITANAGADDDAEPNELTFTLNANVPTPGTGLWTVVLQPC
ncbi:hypothetical protein MASR1M45_14580 [Candidatus Kapaibacterium sp.]